jgi:hypothetical protein
MISPLSASPTPANRSAYRQKDIGCLPVKYEKKKFALVGEPHYAVWYGNVNDTAVNIVVVEAKSVDPPISSDSGKLRITRMMIGRKLG